MSTGNFFKKNARHYYVVEDSRFQDNEDIKDEIKSASDFKDGCMPDFMRIDREQSPLDLCKEYKVDVCGKKAYIEVYPVFNAGYYTDGCLDYRMHLEFEEYDEEIGISERYYTVDEFIEYYLKGNYNCAVISAFRKRVKALVSEIDGEMDRIYTSIAYPLKATARFSNGEVWYGFKDEETEKRYKEDHKKMA